MAKKIMLLYPPGKAYQRGEDRAQCNLEESVVATIHACNDLGYGASVLRQRGYEVSLRDYQTEKAGLDRIQKEISSFAPDAVVLSTTSGAVCADLEFLKWVAAFHICKVVLKGAIFYDISPKLLTTLDLTCVDYLVGGELDVIIGDLMDAALCEKGHPGDVPGILYKENGAFQKTSFDRWFDDLDTIPFPARDLMKNELYPRPDTGEPMATIQVARGCPCRCTYCLTPIISGRSVRKRSIDNIFSEIEECFYQYGIKNFFFRADTFTIDEQWAEALCDRIIRSELHGKIEFTVNARATSLTQELLRKLKKAGCFTIAVGFESGNDNTLRKIQKGATREDNIRAAKLIKAAQIPLFGFFMIGFPWESRQDIVDTLRFMFEIDPDFIEVHIAMPYYGTQLYAESNAYHTIKTAAWGSDYFFPNTIGTQTVPMADIQKMKRRFVLGFYLRPKYILRKMAEGLRNPMIAKNYIVHGFKLLRKAFLPKQW